jgi:rifampin ADP-ribosylating transferase
MTESVRYFHGGRRGLVVGGYILPPLETKVPSTPDYGEMGGLHRKDRVYVTTALVDAQFYAAASQDPIVYEVEPRGNLEDDPDCRGPGRSYACEKAKIIAIHKVRGKLIKKARKKMLQAKSPKQYMAQK